MTTTNPGAEKNKQVGIEQWFDELIGQLKSHQVQLETGTAREEVKDFYDKMMDGELEDVFQQQRLTAQRYFVQKIIVEFLSLLGNKKPHKLAFDYNDSEILVWAEIANDDEAMEDHLLAAEASINAKYHPYGFDISITIVEEDDQMEIPNHYKSIT